MNTFKLNAQLGLAFTVVAILFLTSLSAAAQVPASKHVVMVLEENHSYRSVIGNASMPYLNSLAKKYTLATNYYANTHPSIGNYFMLTTGKIITNNDGYTGTVTADNIVRRIMTAGKTWKSYAESLPKTGYIGGDSGLYSKHHNPFAYFSDVKNSSNERQNLVSFNHFKIDRANGQLPNFSFVIPNMCNDAHSCSLGTADTWLKSNIGPLLASGPFQAGGDGLLIVIFDESTGSDGAHGGGHVVAVAVGPKVKRAYRLSNFYQHQSALKTALKALRVGVFPGSSSSAATIAAF